MKQKKNTTQGRGRVRIRQKHTRRNSSPVSMKKNSPMKMCNENELRSQSVSPKKRTESEDPFTESPFAYPPQYPVFNNQLRC